MTVPSEDSDQPGHPPSLIRVFAVRMMKAWVLSYPLSTQRGLWSDWADSQADLSLCWAHMRYCWFCHVAAHILLIINTEYEWIIYFSIFSVIWIEMHRKYLHLWKFLFLFYFYSFFLTNKMKKQIWLLIICITSVKTYTVILSISRI